MDSNRSQGHELPGPTRSAPEPNPTTSGTQQDLHVLGEPPDTSLVSQIADSSFDGRSTYGANHDAIQPSLSSTPSGNADNTHHFGTGTKYDPKYEDPPSYEEAIKAMGIQKSYVLKPVSSEYTDPEQYRTHPDHGQFGMSEHYFYPDVYTREEDIEEIKCSRRARYVTIFVIIAFFSIIVASAINS